MTPFVIPADAKSWVEVDPGSHFPIQNLPFGLAAPKGRRESVVVAIGDFALDLISLSDAGLIDGEEYPLLDTFLELDKESLSGLRRLVFEILEEGIPVLRDNKKLRDEALIPMEKANLQVPIPPPAFIDFYSGINHASNVGRMFRPEMEPLLPNYRHLPVGYNGRASSVVASGTPIIRPKGQMKKPESVEFGPCEEMDFELEMGFLCRRGERDGQTDHLQSGGGAHFGDGDCERLVGAGHSAVGVSAARAVSFEVVCDLGFALDRDAGCFGAVPDRRDGARS